MANGQETEYYGHKPPAKPFDWVSASEKALGKWEGEVQKRVKERAKNEKVRLKANKTLSKLQKGKNETFNNIVGTAGFTTKDGVYQATQDLYANKINSLEYRKYVNNVTDGWKSFDDIAKQWNDRLQIFADRAEKNDGSAVEAAASGDFSAMADLDHKKIMLGPDGTMFWAKTNDEGDVIPGETSTMDSLNNFPSQLHDRVNLNETVQGYEKNLGVFQGAVQGSDVYKTKGALAMDEFQTLVGDNKASIWSTWVETVTSQILDSPNDAVSVLADNTTGPNDEVYFTYQEKDLTDPADPSKGFKEGSEAAKNILVNNNAYDDYKHYAIKLIRNDAGQLQGDLTTDQREMAEISIENNMRTQVGIENIPPPRFTNTRKSLSSGQRATRAGFIDTYVHAVGASTLNTVGMLQNKNISATAQLRNVKISGGDIVYDIYNPRTDALVKRNGRLRLEDYSGSAGREEERDKAVFGLISGLSGLALDKAFTEAKTHISGAQLSKVKKYRKEHQEFTEADFVSISNRPNMQIISKKQGVHIEKIGKKSYQVPTVTLGHNNPEIYLAEFSSADPSKWDQYWAGDLKHFLERLITTGGGQRIKKAQVTVPNDAKTAKIKLGTITYDYKLTGSADTDKTALEAILTRIQKADYLKRKLGYKK